MNKFSILIIAALVTITSACNKSVQPSGNITTETYNFTGFDAIDISDAFDAFITFSASDESIAIEADDNIHQYLDIKVISDRLYIGVERNYNISGPATLRAYINTNADIEGLYASRASAIQFENELEGDRARLEVSGASRISGAVDLTDLELQSSGASSIDLSGDASNVEANGSGASDFRSLNFVTDNLDIQLSGASSAEFTVNNIMNIILSGASILRYSGEGLIDNISTTGGSEVIYVE